MMRRTRSRISKAQLAEMVEEATVDCYNDSEKACGWFTMIEDHLAVPFEAVVLGFTVMVERIDIIEADQIIAICSRGRHRQSIPILDLALPTSPPGDAEWVEAYRMWARPSSQAGSIEFREE